MREPAGGRGREVEEGREQNIQEGGKEQTEQPIPEEGLKGRKGEAIAAFRAIARR